jgi:hypothetical protein
MEKISIQLELLIRLLLSHQKISLLLLTQPQLHNLKKIGITRLLDKLSLLILQIKQLKTTKPKSKKFGITKLLDKL